MANFPKSIMARQMSGFNILLVGSAIKEQMDQNEDTVNVFHL
jgi:hypothetical protein